MLSQQLEFISFSLSGLAAIIRWCLIILQCSRPLKNTSRRLWQIASDHVNIQIGLFFRGIWLWAEEKQGWESKPHQLFTIHPWQSTGRQHSSAKRRADNKGPGHRGPVRANSAASGKSRGGRTCPSSLLPKLAHLWKNLTPCGLRY